VLVLGRHAVLVLVSAVYEYRVFICIHLYTVLHKTGATAYCGYRSRNLPGLLQRTILEDPTGHGSYESRCPLLHRGSTLLELLVSSPAALLLLLLPTPLLQLLLLLCQRSRMISL
jgi:hypothetical protein